MEFNKTDEYKEPSDLFLWRCNKDENSENNPAIESSREIRCKCKTVSAALTNLQTFILSSDGEVLELCDIDEYSYTLVRFPTLVDITQVSTGCYHLAALSSNGCAFLWGSFFNGNIGKEKLRHANSPKQLLPNVQLVAIVSGDNHLALLSESGKLYTIGSAKFGQLGRLSESLCKYIDENNDCHYQANLVGFSTDVFITGLWAGQAATYCAVDSNLYACGLVPGFNNNENIYFPRRLRLPNNIHIRSISSSYQHLACVSTQGMIYTIGNNEYGQLGNNSNLATEDFMMPTLEPSVSVLAKNHFTMALTISGCLYTWGLNGFTEKQESTPKIIDLNGKVRWYYMGEDQTIICVK